MDADFSQNPFLYYEDLTTEVVIRERRRVLFMRKGSVSFKRHLLLILSLFIIPMLFFLFLYNYYSIRTLNDEVAQVGNNIIEVYRSKTEHDLQSLSMTIAEYWANDYDHVNMVNQVDELTRHLSGHEIGIKYRSLLTMNSFLE